MTENDVRDIDWEGFALRDLINHIAGRIAERVVLEQALLRSAATAVPRPSETVEKWDEGAYRAYLSRPRSEWDRKGAA